MAENPGAVTVGQGVRALYADTLAEKGFRSDAAQLGAIEALERCEREWADYKARRSNALTKLLSRPPIPRGVYMHGGVGRGKSFLMDCFFQSVPLTRKTRLHFHEFMREVHRELQDLKGTVNPLDELGRRIARRFRLRHRRDDPASSAGVAVRQPRQHRHDVELPS